MKIVKMHSLKKAPEIDYLKIIQKNADTEAQRNGKAIFEAGNILHLILNTEKEIATAVLRNLNGIKNKLYTYKVTDYLSYTIEATCTCNSWKSLCQHGVAVMLALNKANGETVHNEPIVYDPKNTILRRADYDEDIVRVAGEQATNWANAVRLAAGNGVKILSALDARAECTVTFKKETYNVVIERDKTKSDFLNTSCTCDDTKHLLCMHKQAVLLKLLDKFGRCPFDSMKDWTADKNRLLAEYGFSLKDNIDDKFDFIIENGNIKLMLLDGSIHKINQDWKGFQQKLLPTTLTPEKKYTLPEASKKRGIAARQYRSELAYGIYFNEVKAIPEFGFKPILLQYDALTGAGLKFKELKIGEGEEPVIEVSDTTLLKLIHSASKAGLESFIRKENLKSFRSGWYGLYFEKSNYDPADIPKVQIHLNSLYEEMLPLFAGKRLFALSSHYTFKDIEEVKLSQGRAKPVIILKEDKEFSIAEVQIRLGEETFGLLEIERFNYWFIRQGKVLWKLDKVESLSLLDYFERTGSIRIKKEFLPEFLKSFITPLSEKFPLEIQMSKKPVAHSAEPASRLYLKEEGDFLLFVPAFEYQYKEESREFEADNGESFFIEHGGKIIQMMRSTPYENEMFEFLRSLHPEFETQPEKYFYLNVKDLLSEGWFLSAFEKIREKGFEILGQNELKKLRYNTHSPKVKFSNSSGIDWFDMEMEISFGEQSVSLADVRRAVLARQQFVKLGDGSLGMLPLEWLEKYASLLKFGKVKGNNLKISKIHFSLIDTLAGEIDNEEILREIAEKKQKLLHFKEIKSIPLPDNIHANLRPYQEEGYKWMNFLDEFGWGGCLADDMGLGKTLQMLCFLGKQKQVFPDGVSLVVMPTTLIFNWSAEIEKFCPELTVYTHSGGVRGKDLSIFKKYDVILTTYGTLRSDIALFSAFKFHYIILDESQAIKNPDSQISKAVRLLKATNRMVLTGTPIENNTFDLYSQMEFLNPGLLGNSEFFRVEYANPIDKYRDEQKAKELRKLIYPFILKRTKEEVATDLPEKTETVLYCEMDKGQRKVYEAFKNKYRVEIMKKISEEGVQKSGFLILEGLLKLRQICDSPALLSDEGDYGTDSAKLEEIVREIEENAGNHKILVFSQFLKMLDLIRHKLEKINIPYVYLDGQTKDRREKVNTFQEDENTRVFLISLKAGGVGINLTEADYVYIVDPWWNPAVEQQAIDRSHRIGQKRHVFAYKMICKDSVEEKILKLQEKKKAVAGDLISTEEGFLKKLSPKDIEHLFS